MNAEPMPALNSDPYRALGVRPFISCCSVRTLHGGSVMLPQVRRAVDAASRQLVNLDELMEAAGQRISELTGADWGMVTCGSAAALALATAACVAGNDPVKMLRLPFTEGMANRVVMLSGQRFSYDLAVRMVGTRIVVCASAAELEAAFDGGDVAMVCLLGKSEASGPVRLEEIVALARPRGIPVLVDAAAEHLTRPNPWLARGADLVIHSGGKFLRGPQTSGLLLGRKNLVQAAWRNAAPHHAFGRPMKVSKEGVIGVVAALEVWFNERDVAAEQLRWQHDLDEIARLIDQPGVNCQVIAPAGEVKVPALKIAWQAEQVPISSYQVRQILLDATPRIMLDDTSATTYSLRIDPFNLQPGEAKEVGLAIARVLGDARPSVAGASVPAVTLEGDWDVKVEFLFGHRVHRLTLHQDGAGLSGWQDSPQFSGTVTGTVSGDSVELHFEAVHEGATIVFSLTGTASSADMTGTAQFGVASGASRGEFNLRQLGGGTFTASRLTA